MAKKPIQLDANGKRKFGMRDKLAYAAGDLGCNMSFALKGTVQTFWLVYMMMETGLLSILLLAVQIWDAIKFGAVIENVVMDPETRVADYDDDSLTENIRTGYPVEHIPGAVLEGRGGQPAAIIFLTADAFGVLPPVSRLDRNQASYYYLSGYTSKLAGTERGITEPQATFSAGFGAPFLPRAVGEYAALLRENISKYGAEVYMLNTGWTGGPYGVGSRMKLAYTRAMVTAALNGELKDVEYEVDPIFGLSIPKTCPNVPDEVLNPRATWEDKAAYDETAGKLAQLFAENFKTYNGVEEEIAAAGPKAVK